MMQLKHSQEYYHSNFFKWRQRIGFGISDYACNLAFLVANTYLLFYYTNIVGLSAGVAGVMFIVTKFIDGFTDYTVGILVDHTDTKMGRCRPWMLFGAPVLAIGMVLLFSVPVEWSSGAKLAWAYGSYILFTFGYTLVNIPLAPCVTLLTPDFQERTNIMTVKQMFGKAGALTSSLFLTPLIYFFAGDSSATGSELATGYRMANVVLGVAIVIIYTICVFNIEEINVPSISSKPKKKEKKSIGVKLAGIGRDMKDIFKNKYFTMMVFFFFLYYVAYYGMYNSIQYYFTYVIGKPSAMSIALSCITAIPIPIFIFAAWLVSKGVGKARLLLIGGILNIIGFICMFLSPNVTTAILSIAIYGVGCGFRSSIMFATLPDIFDFTEYQTGRSLSGIQMAVTGLGNKVGSAAASAYVSALLVWGSYNASKLDGILDSGGTVQDIASGYPDTVLAIKLAVCGVTLVATVLSILVMIPYDLDKKAPQIRKELAKKQPI